MGPNAEVVNEFGFDWKINSIRFIGPQQPLVSLLFSPKTPAISILVFILTSSTIDND